MKKVFVFSLFGFALVCLTTSAKAQNNCYAYGHNKVACPGSDTEQKTVSTKEKVEVSKEDTKTEKKNSATQLNSKKYNATEFKTKRYSLFPCK